MFWRALFQGCIQNQNSSRLKSLGDVEYAGETKKELVIIHPDPFFICSIKSTLIKRLLWRLRLGTDRVFGHAYNVHLFGCHISVWFSLQIRTSSDSVESNRVGRRMHKRKRLWRARLWTRGCHQASKLFWRPLRNRIPATEIRSCFCSQF